MSDQDADHPRQVTAADFALTAQSPAIGEADPAFAPALDLLGNARDGEPDMGAIEFVP